MLHKEVEKKKKGRRESRDEIKHGVCLREGRDGGETGEEREGRRAGRGQVRGGSRGAH